MDTSTLDLFGYFRLKAELETSEKNTDESEKGGKKESERLGVPLLGKIPIEEEITISTDKGIPISKVKPESNAGLVFHSISKKIIKTLT